LVDKWTGHWHQAYLANEFIVIHCTIGFSRWEHLTFILQITDAIGL
jgi:hypothetical protein